MTWLVTMCSVSYHYTVHVATTVVGIGSCVILLYGACSEDREQHALWSTQKTNCAITVYWPWQSRPSPTEHSGSSEHHIGMEHDFDHNRFEAILLLEDMFVCNWIYSSPHSSNSELCPCLVGKAHLFTCILAIVVLVPCIAHLGIAQLIYYYYK